MNLNPNGFIKTTIKDPNGLWIPIWPFLFLLWLISERGMRKRSLKDVLGLIVGLSGILAGCMILGIFSIGLLEALTDRTILGLTAGKALGKITLVLMCFLALAWFALRIFWESNERR